MKKFQVIRCKTCGTVYSAANDKYIDENWYQQCAREIKKGNATVETIENGDPFEGKEINKCCGNSVKQLSKINLSPQ